MATYAEYQQQTMASNDNDFTLFPYMWNQEQTYIPTSTFDDHSYLQQTTLDSYATQQSYAPVSANDQFTFNVDAYNTSKNNLQAPHQGYSPANSASHSFDLQNPPMLSSTSDSGASVQSTTSSGTNSPALQPQQSSDWVQQAGMNMIPGIVHHDSMAHDIFASTGVDFETIPVTDKGCVGEFTHFSSSQQREGVSDMYFTSLPASFDCTQFQSCIGTSLWSPSPNINARDFATAQAPRLQISSSVESASPNDSVFKSPDTPASATATSPVLERVKGKRKASTTPPAAKRARGSSPLSRLLSLDEESVPTRPHAPPPTLQSPFFYQSSGSFVPPLELSYPSLIQPTFSPTQWTGAQFPELPAMQQPQNLQPFAHAPSPMPNKSSGASPRVGKAPSPNVRTHNWQPYPAYPGSRRQSISSVHSRHSQGSLSSGDDSNKGLCPIPTCGRHVKDLKAHMLTHQNERPEKCPIPTCEYHIKGFARKYDKNRHTLTHYKGTMVCGFCPGSGSAAEKSFNRADVFKRHLTSVHGVEQTPPNARRKSPSVSAGKRPFIPASSGMCSTCGVTFSSAQDFYEHLDDCVLRVVQQAEPSEAINEKLLSSVAEDQVVQETMERHQLPAGIDLGASTSFDQEEDAEEDEEDDEDDSNDGTYGARSGRSGKGAIKSRKSAGTSS